MATKENSYKAIEELYSKLEFLADVEKRLGFYNDAVELEKNFARINYSEFSAREAEAYLKMLRDLYYAEETKFLVHIFEMTNATDKEIEAMTGISSSTIGRRLNPTAMRGDDPFVGYKIAFGSNWEKIYKDISNKRQENLFTGKLKGSHISKINNTISKNENDLFSSAFKLRLDMFTSNVNSHYKIVANISKVFGLSPKSMSQLFGIDEVEVKDIIDAFKVEDAYAFDQEKAILELREFYTSYSKAKVMGGDSFLKLIEVKGEVKSINEVSYLLGINPLFNEFDLEESHNYARK